MLFAALWVSRGQAQEAPIVEEIEVRGARADHRPQLRARVDLDVGTPVDEAAIERARLDLLGSGLVRTAEARLERGSRRGRVRVVFEVEERTTFGLDALYLGSARPTRLWGGAEVSDLDPFGFGFGLSAGVVSSGAQTGARLGVAVPRAPLPGAHLRFGALFVDGEEPFVGPAGQRLGGRPVDDLRVPYRRAGGDVGLTFDLDGVSRADFRLRVEGIHADLPRRATQIEADGTPRPFDFRLDDGGSLLIELAGGLTFDRRDDPVRPTRGLRAELLGRTGGGDYAYFGLQGGVQQHFRPWLRHSLRLDALAGVVVGDAPFFERFFVGDLHPYIPSRVLGVNFARRRGPHLLPGQGLDRQRYEALAGRLGVEYAVPLGPPDDPYPVDLFVGGALLALGSPGDPPDFGERPLPFDAALDAGLRIQTEIGVFGLSVGTLLLVVGP